MIVSKTVFQRVDLAGLSVASPTINSILLGSLHRCGLSGEAIDDNPLQARLDWSRADGCAADGLAFFAVVSTQLRQLGRLAGVVAPSDNRLAALLESLVLPLRLRDSSENWTTSPLPGFAGRQADLVAATVLRGGGANVDAFLNSCAHAVESHRDAILSRRVMSCVHELVANMLEHGAGTPAAAVALRFPRRRPVTIQIGLADGGVGVAATLLQQDRHSTLAPFRDATILDVVFRNGFSGRPLGDGGGAFGRLFVEVAASKGVEIAIRSGRGRICTTKKRNEFDRETYLHGIGTQSLLTLKFI